MLSKLESDFGFEIRLMFRVRYTDFVMYKEPERGVS